MFKHFLPAQTIELMLTRSCNMNCTYCFEKNKKGNDLDFDKLYSLLFNYKFSMPMEKFYLFGGEPMMNLPLVVQIIEKIKEDPEINSTKKDYYIQNIVRNFTTNGTLIDKNIDILKKYNFSLQVSIDGPEDINDLHRVDYSGKGHFKQIMDNIELLRKNDLYYCFHGAVNGENFKNFDRINEWFIEQDVIRDPEKESENTGFMETCLYSNYCQILFEDNYTDEQINDLLLAYERTVKMIFETPLLDSYPKSIRKTIAEGFLARQGGPCSAGNSMFAIDNEFFIYPCHRLMTSTNDEDKSLSLDGINVNRKGGTNYKLYEALLDLPLKKHMYGQLYDNDLTDPNNLQLQANWCPSTNYEVTGNVYVLPPHYTLLIRELQSFIPKLAEYYNLDIINYRNNHDRKSRTSRPQNKQ